MTRQPNLIGKVWVSTKLSPLTVFAYYTVQHSEVSVPYFYFGEDPTCQPLSLHVPTFTTHVYCDLQVFAWSYVCYAQKVLMTFPCLFNYQVSLAWWLYTITVYNVSQAFSEKNCWLNSIHIIPFYSDYLSALLLIALIGTLVWATVS